MIAETRPAMRLKFHAIDRICPFCTLAKLSYQRHGHHGDVYECAYESGGCGRSIVRSAAEREHPLWNCADFEIRHLRPLGGLPGHTTHCKRARKTWCLGG